MMIGMDGLELAMIDLDCIGGHDPSWALLNGLLTILGTSTCNPNIMLVNCSHVISIEL